jgi:anti-anti-sigma factor
VELVDELDAPVLARGFLDDLLAQLQQADVKNVVVDLGEVAYFGTTMLEAMHALWRCVRTADGKMALCRVSTMGCEVLRVSGFDALWPICASQEEALLAVRD